MAAAGHEELLTPSTADLSGQDDMIASPDDASLTNQMDMITPPPKRKGGRKPIYATTEERKQRNRQAQAAFRERRTEYIKQLEVTMKDNEDTLKGLRQSHREIVDQCHMLRYKTSLLEELLEDHGIDYRAELQARSNRSMFGQPRTDHPAISPRHEHVRNQLPHVKRSGSNAQTGAIRPRPRPKLSRYSIDSPQQSAPSPSSFSFPSLESDVPGFDSPDGMESSHSHDFSPHPQSQAPPHSHRLPALPFPSDHYTPGVPPSMHHNGPPPGGYYHHDAYRLSHTSMASDRLGQESVTRSTPDHPIPPPQAPNAEHDANPIAIPNDETQRKAYLRESMLKADLLSLFDAADRDDPIRAEDIYVQGLNVGSLMNDYGLDDARWRKPQGTRPWH